MAVAYGGVHNFSAGNAGNGISFNGTLPTGAYLVLTVLASASATSISVTGGTWITAIPYNSTNYVSQTFFRTTRGTGGNVGVTINFPVDSDYAFSSVFFTGSNGTISSSTSDNTGTNTPVSVTSPATSASGDLTLGVGSSYGSANISGAGTGFTLNNNFRSFLFNRGIAYESRVALASGETYTTAISGSSLVNNKIGSFVIQNTPADNFTGWGIPL
jgi:hypothetical protein